MPGKNKTPLVGWHPRADLVAWLEAEVQRRGGGRGTRSALLDEALTLLRAKHGTPEPSARPATRRGRREASCTARVDPGAFCKTCGQIHPGGKPS